MLYEYVYMYIFYITFVLYKTYVNMHTHKFSITYIALCTHKYSIVAMFSF